MDNELIHYGILGMKWGIRRFQNKDGTLTPAGRKRYYNWDVQRTSTQLGRTMITRKRQLAADKSDLEKLNSGKHLSVGFTKKRQDAYDKRDKAALERRIKYNEQRGHLTKKDNKWIKKNADKITEKARKKSSKELMKYANELMKNPNAVNKSGKLSAATINAYNQKMASLMNEQVSNLRSPSGKVVRFVAKRGEIGVFMALADQGYNMNQLKNGIYESGKVAYRKTVVDKV